MAESIKSVLLVDFDSLHRSLSADDEAAAQRLALRLPAWINAIEAGNLFVETPDEPQRRRILIRRCYADPSLLGDERKIFLTNGFQVVDCPPAEGRTHNTAAIHMVLDSIDAIEHPTGYEDFILLSADSDLSPLLIRLRANNRTTSIYTNAVTAESYKSIADAMIEESRFAEVLLSDDEPESDDEEEAPAPAERSEVEALARKIASATNVPLFAPRTFADLFRHLVAEVSENGYHFQKTAENVATRMADAGRNVSRRQVVFVVKGLALKGHVFSSGDTADRLAEVFREQVLYLAENAGVPLDDNDQRVLSDWIVGSTSTASPAEKTVPSKTDAAPKSNGKAGSAKPTGSQQPSRAARRRQQKSNAAVKPHEEAKAATPATEPAKPAEPSKPLTKPSGADKPSTSAGRDQTKPTAAEPKPAAGSAKQSNGSATPTAAAERSSKEDKPQSNEPAVTAVVSRTTGTAATAKQRTPSRDADKDAEADTDTVESSILAAIAEAVDVLVEDSGEADDGDTPDQSPAQTDKKANASAESEEEEEAEGDDIGDEIQRIIASYNRNRKTGGDN